MLKLFFKKYWIYISVYILYQLILYLQGLNSNNPIPYFNFVIYFISFLLIHAALEKTEFNILIVKLFYLFYGYLSIIVSLAVLTRHIHELYFIVFFITEIILGLFLLVISLYLVFYSLRAWNISDKSKIYLSILISIVITTVTYFSYFQDPTVIVNKNAWTNLLTKGNIPIVFSVLLMLVFWYRYFQKYCVVSEFLNSIIFLFTIFNMIQALNFIAFQWDIQIWFKSQIFNILVNLLMVIIWYARFVYLNTEISIENERFLINFQYLNGFIAKPRKSWFSKILPFLSVHNALVIFSFLSLTLVVLYFIHTITFYLLLNTVFILLIMLFALYFSFSSLKRDWNNQLNLLTKMRK